MREIHIRRMAYNDARMKLETELNDAFMQSERRVHIVHGIGQGKLKAMAIKVVNDYDFCGLVPDEYILRPNPGVLVVDLFPPDRATLRMYRA
ncbi:MAG: DNA mismatch repair protein [Leptospirales bacterium]